MSGAPDHSLWAALGRDLEQVCADGSRAELGVALAHKTSLRVGGPAAVWLEVASEQGLGRALRWLSARPEVPRLPLGAGSNTLASDDGFAGVVLALGRGLARVELGAQAGQRREGWGAGAVRVEVGGATRDAHVVRDLHRAGLVGPEFLALIPGTFGGAVAMNAGTRWGELKHLLLGARCVTPEGERVELSVEALGMGYRHAELPPGAVVVGGAVVAWPGSVEEARHKIKAERAYRNQTQPYHMPCAGSFFANPPGDSAGRLIEAAGLKGLAWGGAEVSPMHANFIVNARQARAQEVLELMALARRAVRARFGVELRPEVRLLGFGAGPAAQVLDALPLPPALEAKLQGAPPI